MTISVILVCLNHRILFCILIIGCSTVSLASSQLKSVIPGQYYKQNVSRHYFRVGTAVENCPHLIISILSNHPKLWITHISFQCQLSWSWFQLASCLIDIDVRRLTLRLWEFFFYIKGIGSPMSYKELRFKVYHNAIRFPPIFPVICGLIF